MCVYIMCEEWTLCMFCTCQEQTFDPEWTSSMSIVGFDFSFGLVILENPGIGIEMLSRIMLYMNES